MWSIIIYNIFIVGSLALLFKGIIDARYRKILELEIMKGNEEPLENSDLPMTVTEKVVFDKLPRSERNRIKNNFLKMVRKGLLIKVKNERGDEGYVTKSDFIKNRNKYKGL